MKFTSIALLLLGSVEATKLKSQTRMQSDIQNMSMNANMHKIALREKTLLKTYLEVDMNEFLQSKMDSELFEGVTEQNKSEFIGNFFHFVKCRFQDCNLVQTKAKINMKQASTSPTAAESKAKEDALNLNDWASGHGNNVQAYNAGNSTRAAPAAGGKAPASLAQVTSPTAAESKIREDNLNLNDWASGHGNNVQAYNAGNSTRAAPAAGGKAPAALAQTEKKERITTNTSKQVAADLEKEKSQELVVPHIKADSDKDTAPVELA